MKKGLNLKFCFLFFFFGGDCRIFIENMEAGAASLLKGVGSLWWTREKERDNKSTCLEVIKGRQGESVDARCTAPYLEFC